MKKQSAFSKVLSVVLSVLMVLPMLAGALPMLAGVLNGTVAFAAAKTETNPYYVNNQLTWDYYGGASSGDLVVSSKLKANDDGSFRILQIADPQTTAPLPEDMVSLIRQGIARVKPNLIVLTGDNAMYANADSSFENTMAYLASLFYDGNGYRIPFAVTFGNHDTNNNKYNPDDWDEREILEQYWYGVRKLGALDYDYSDIADIGTGCINVYNSDGTQVVQKVLLLNSAVDDDNGGYGKVGYNQNSNYNDEDCYNTVCVKLMSEVAANVPTVAFQHIPLREFYTANGILTSTGTSSDGTSRKAYDEIGSDLTVGGIAVTSQYFKRAEGATGEYNEACCCSYSTTELLYRTLANHATDVTTTYSGNAITYPAHNNVKGIFYGHDHSNTLTGTGTITYDGVDFTLTQGYGGGMCLRYSSTNRPFISGYTMYNDVSRSIEKVVWDPNTINNDYSTTFGSKHTVSGVDSSARYVCDIAIGARSPNAAKTVNTLTSEAIDKAESTLQTRYSGNSDIQIVRLEKMQDSVKNDERRSDANYDAGGNYIGFAYATTSNVNNAVTDIIIRASDSEEAPSTIIKEKYGTQITYSLVSTKDLNDDAGGSYLLMYLTRDPAAGAPITAFRMIRVDSDKDSAEYGGYYQTVQYAGNNAFQDAADLNKGCGSDVAYLILETKTIGTASTTKDATTYKDYDITCQYMDLAKAYSPVQNKSDSYNYTAESWSNFVTARTAAKNIKTHIDTHRWSSYTKAQIVTATQNLTNAYNALTPATAVIGDDQSTVLSNTVNPTVLIAVPETVYLKPSAGKATEAKDYLNNKIQSNTLIAEEGSSTTGKFYIKTEDSADVTVSTDRYQVNTDGSFTKLADTNNLTMTNDAGGSLASGVLYDEEAANESNEISDNIGTLTLGTNGLDATKTCLIEWKFEVKHWLPDLNGDSNPEYVITTHYAYTTVYAPNNHSVGAITETNDYLSSGSRVGQTSFSAWISGVEGLSDTQISFGADGADGEKLSETGSGTFVADPIVGLSTIKYKGIKDSDDTIKLSLGDFINTSGGNYVNAKTTYHVNYNSRGTYSMAVRGYTGKLTVDSSRYTNLNQVPNLYVGTDLIGSFYHNDMFSKTSNHLYGYYAVKPSTVTSTTSPTYGITVLGTQLNGVSNGDWTQYVNINNSGNEILPLFYLGSSNGFGNANQLMAYGDDNEAGARLYQTVNSAWNSSMNGYNLLQAIQTRNYEAWSVATVIVTLTSADKSTLRQNVGNAVNSNLQQKWDTNGSYNTFKTELMKASLKLGTPSDTTNTSAALTAAQTACASGQMSSNKANSYNYAFVKNINIANGSASSYRPNGYDITAKGKNTEQTVEKGKLFLLQDSEIPGYTYIGSKQISKLPDTAVSSTVAGDIGLTTYPIVDEMSVEAINSNRTKAYHYYLAPEFTLTIDPNGGKIGDGAGYTTVTGNYTSTFIGDTTHCTRTGYVFAGWKLISGAGSVNGMIYTFGEGDATIQAMWTPVGQTVTISTNGGSYGGNLIYFDGGAETVSDGTQSTLHYTASYESDGDITFTGVYPAHAGTEINLRTTKLHADLAAGKKYRISYSSTNDSTEFYLYIGDMTYHSGFLTRYSVYNNATGLYEYTREFTVGKKVFDGNSSNDANWDTAATDDLTATYHFRFDCDETGGNAGSYEVTNLKIVSVENDDNNSYTLQRLTDSYLPLVAPTRAGYDFQGWTISPNDNGSQLNGSDLQVGTSATTLTAQWEPIVIHYDVNHDNIRQNATILSSMPTTSGITLTHDRATDVYTLNGTAEDEISMFYIPIRVDGGDIYKITVTEVGGTRTNGVWNDGYDTGSITFESRPADKVSDPAAGRVFVDFYEAGNITQTLIYPADKDYSDVAYLQVRIYKNAQSITFENYQFKWKIEKVATASDAVSVYSPAARTVNGATYGDALVTLPTRAGYTFLGWATTQDGTRPVYNGYGEIVGSVSSIVAADDAVTESQTLYAQWRKNSAVVTYDNLFNISKYEVNAQSAYDEDSLTVDAENGTVTYTNAVKSTKHFTESDYHINVKPSTEYLFKFKVQGETDGVYGDFSLRYFDAQGDEIVQNNLTFEKLKYDLIYNSTQADNYYDRAENLGVWGSFNNAIVTDTGGYVSAVFTTPADVAYVVVNFGADDDAGKSVTFSDITLSPTSYQTANGSLNASDISYTGARRAVYNNTSADMGTLTVPSATGFVFGGWVNNETGEAITGNPNPADYPNGLTLVSTWDRSTYTVTWKNGDTTVETDENVVHGSAASYDGSQLTKSATAEYTYTFAGWTANKHNAGELGSDTLYNSETLPAVTADVTYYAYFIKTAQTYTFTYTVNGATYQSFDVGYGSSVPTVTAPSVAGYQFTGWSGTYTTMPAHNVTVSANLSGLETYYQIEIYLSDSLGNYSASAETVTVSDGVVTGMDLSGFSPDARQYYVLDTSKNNYAGMKVAYAKDGTPTVLKVYYLEDFNNNGTSDIGEEHINVSFTAGDNGALVGGNKTVSMVKDILWINALTKKPDTMANSGYSFENWTDLSGNTPSTLTADTTLRANFSINGAMWSSITWSYHNAPEGGEQVTVLKSETVLPTAPTVGNYTENGVTYTFTGWNPAVGYPTNDSYTYTAVYSAAVTVTPVFTQNAGENGKLSGVTSAMEYSLDGGNTWTTGNGNDITVAQGQTIIYRAKKANDASQAGAQTSHTAVEYVTVTYNYNGKSETESVIKGANPANAPTKATLNANKPNANTCFANWECGSVNVPDVTVAVSADTVYDAVYGPDLNRDDIPDVGQDKITVTFTNSDTQKGTVTGTTEFTMVQGILWENAMASAPTVNANKGYRFTGWATQVATLTANTELTAVYEENPSDWATVTWTWHGGSNTTHVIKGVDVPTYADPATYDESNVIYEFNGWNSTPAVVSGDTTYAATYKAKIDTAKVTLTQPAAGTDTTGSLNGVTSAMEYSTDGGKTWTTGNGSAITVAQGTTVKVKPVAEPGEETEFTATQYFTVTYNYNTSSSTEVVEKGLKPQNVPEKATVNAAAANQNLCFAYWKYGEHEAIPADTVINSNTVFTAQYAQDLNQNDTVDTGEAKIHVSFNQGDHGTIVNNPVSVEVVSGILWANAIDKAPTVSADKGYQFSAWTTEISAITTDNYVITATYSIKADDWATVTWTWHGGSNTTQVIKSVDVPTHTNPDAYTENGVTYTFKDWGSALAAVDNDTAYTAHYTAAISTAPTLTQPVKANENGKLSGVTSAMEYSTDGGNTWTKGNGSVIDVSQGTTVKVRAAATATSEAGDVSEYTADRYYTVTYSYNGETKTADVKEGTAPAGMPDNTALNAAAPTLQCFSHWTKDGTKVDLATQTVNANATYEAVYKADLNDNDIPDGDPGDNTYYTVTFNQGTNGTIEGNPKEVSMISGISWTVAQTLFPAVSDEAGYHFTGWNNTFTTLTGNTSLTAQYAINDGDWYTITWVYHGNTESKSVYIGSTPTHTTPETYTENGVTYTFNKWSPDVVAADNNAQYTAVYTAKIADGTVSFTQPEKGIGTKGTLKGVTSSMQYTTDNGVSWTDGTGSDIEIAQGVTVKVRVKGNEAAEKTYTADQYFTVTFVNYDGSAVDTQTVIKNGGAIKPTSNPSRANCTFKAWDVPFNNIIADTTVTALYTTKINGVDTDVEKNQVVVDFVNHDDTLLQRQLVTKGNTPVYGGAIPTKASTNTQTFSFNNTWNPALGAVNTDTVFKAQFNAATRTYAVTVTANEGVTVTPTSGSVEYGQSFTFTVTPDEKYSQNAPVVTVTGATCTDNKNGTYTLTDITDGATVTVNPGAINQYTVTYSYSGNVANETVAHGGTLAQIPNAATLNTAVTADKCFAYFTKNGTKVDDMSAQTVTADVTYVAVYKDDLNENDTPDEDETDTVTVTFDKGTNGTLSGTTAITAVKGIKLKYLTKPTVTPDNFYVFKGWDKTEETAFNTSATVTALYGDDKNDNGTEDYTEGDTETVTVTFNAGTNGKIEGSVTKVITVIKGCAKQFVTAPTVTANQYYVFKSWNNTAPDTYAENTVFNAVYGDDKNDNGTEDDTGDDTDKVTVTFNAGTNGKIEGNTTKVITVIKGCAKQFVTAPTVTANQYYVFKGWDNTAPEAYDSNTEFTATYGNDYNDNGTEDDTGDDTAKVTLTFNAGTNGKIEGSATKVITVIKGCAKQFVTVPTVTANQYYAFTGFTPEQPAVYSESKEFTAQYADDKNDNGYADYTEKEGVYDDTATVTVTFNAGTNGKIAGGSTKVITVIKGCKAQFVTAPTVTANQYYVFKGWNQTAPEAYENDFTFTAQYTDDKNDNGTADEEETKYTVEIRFVDENNNQIAESMFVSDIVGMNYSVIIADIVNYIKQNKSYNKAEGVITAENSVITVTFYADMNNDGIPDKDQSHKVTFKVNGETVDTQNVIYGGNATAPEGDYYVITENGHAKVTGWDKDLTNITSDITVNGVSELAVTAHTFGYWNITKEATCSVAGSRYHTCTGCGYVHTESYKLAHKNTTFTAKPATCIEPGWNEYQVCSVCGESTKVEIPAPGHKFGSWVITKNQTTTEDGEKERVCSVCGFKETEKIHVDLNILLRRSINFRTVSKMYYIGEGIDSELNIYNSDTVKWYEDVDYHFRAYNYSNSGYDRVYIYIDGDLATPNSQGIYTIPGGKSTVNVIASFIPLGEETTTQEGGGSGTGGCTHICHSSNWLLKIIWKIVNLICKVFKINQYCSCGAKHW